MKGLGFLLMGITYFIVRILLNQSQLISMIATGGTGIAGGFLNDAMGRHPTGASASEAEEESTTPKWCPNCKSENLEEKNYSFRCEDCGKRMLKKKVKEKGREEENMPTICSKCKKTADECQTCESELSEGNEILCFKGKTETFHFCDEDCLKNWLHKKFEDRITEAEVKEGVREDGVTQEEVGDV